jgi:hypothetical protein
MYLQRPKSSPRSPFCPSISSQPLICFPSLQTRFAFPRVSHINLCARLLLLSQTSMTGLATSFCKRTDMKHSRTCRPHVIAWILFFSCVLGICFFEQSFKNAKTILYWRGV